MSLTKFNESVTNHQSLPDKPTLSSAELKTLWDKAGVDIKNYLNQILTEELDSKESNLRQLIQQNTSNISNMLNTVYPVGSIYMSVNNANPSTIFGGTWVAWGAGKVPVGVNANETEFNSVEKTGGAKTHTLTTQQMPSHTHTFHGNAHNHSLNNHIHNFSGTTSLDGEFGAKFNALANANTVNLVAEVWGTAGRDYSATGYYDTADRQRKESDFYDRLTVDDHNHTFSGTTGQASGNTGNATQTGYNDNTGGGQAHNNLQPYITCYMWKRTA